MRLTKLLENLDGEIFYEGKSYERDVATLSHDTQTEMKGSLFFCLVGGRFDGHNFAKQAIKKGAVALVVERKLDVDVPQFIVKNARETLSFIAAKYYGMPAERLKIIAVTGTNGKTTTAHMLAEILRSADKEVGIIGTLGISYGDKKYPASLTTPDPIPFHKTLAEMFLCGVEYVVMEVSAHAMYYAKTAGIRFSACIFTNLSQDHLDFFTTMQLYKETKKKLFHADICPFAVINADDETGREIAKMRANLPNVTTQTYAINSPADAFAIVTDSSLSKTECIFNVNDELARVRLHFTGNHNVYNALSATVCALHFGVKLKQAVRGLSALQGVRGRLEKVESYKGADIFVDFAHTPDGLKQTLCALRTHCKGRLICLFGCGGNRDASKRALMGETVAKNSDFALLTADNPRYEDPLDIIAEMEKGYRRFSQKYVVIPTRERAIEYAIEHLQKGDVLLVAGKGGEDYQEIMGIKYPFNDNDIIKKYIEKDRAKEKETR